MVGFKASDRAQRAAMNQMLFRDINERVKDLESNFTVVIPVGAWICECANVRCENRIAMSAEEYETIRGDGACFFVAPGDEHVWDDVERVTDRNDRYWIVEKFGISGEIVRKADPRSDQAPG